MNEKILTQDDKGNLIPFSEMRKKQENHIRNAKLRMYQTKQNEVKQVKEELNNFRQKKAQEEQFML